jgi:hypothetical protein
MEPKEFREAKAAIYITAIRATAVVENALQEGKEGLTGEQKAQLDTALQFLTIVFGNNNSLAP